MKLLRSLRLRRRDPRAHDRRGAALLLSLLILLVLVAIVIQINVGTSTDARVARNDVGLTTMDGAAESSLLQVYEQLATDGQASGGGAGGAGAPGATGGGPAAAAANPGAAPGAAGGQPAQPTDSRRDEWAQPLRTEINEIRLRIFVQDEDSKLNVLTMLDPDEDRAKAAFDRVVRCLDLCREGTSADIDARTAEDMAKAMLEHMQRRKLAKQPRPALLSDDEQDEDRGLPLSLREFGVLEPFDESHFRDFRDEDGEIIHSVGAFLTVWSSVVTYGEKPGASSTGGANVAGGAGAAKSGSGGGSGNAGSGAGNKSGSSPGGGGSPASSTAPSETATAGGGTAPGADPANPGVSASAAQQGGAQAQTGGYAVNVNTAPPAVLKALFDDREVHPRFWDQVVEHRNLEEEQEEGEEAPEPQLDEYGEEIIERRIFDSLAEVAEIEGFHELEPALQQQVNQLLTTQSHVFSIFVVARRTTSLEGDLPPEIGGRPRRGEEDEKGDALVRVVRSVVWRHQADEETVITPLVRWEVLDYVPYEVLDYPEEDR